MAVQQPLTAFSGRVSDHTLMAIDPLAPTIRRVHAALDRCADESGPIRFENAVVAMSEGANGGFYLSPAPPSQALLDLFATASDARGRFAEQLTICEPDFADGSLEISSFRVSPVGSRVPMDVFLAALEVDPQTTPSSLEKLFEGLEAAHATGLIEMTADSLSLTDDGRRILSTARDTLQRLDDQMVERIDLHAQEYSDGRLSLHEAFQSLSREVDLELPAPGTPDEAPVVQTRMIASSEPGLEIFGPILQATATLPSGLRSAVVIKALHQALCDWGLEADVAESVLRFDTRVLRLLGASLSHGPLSIEEAEKLLSTDPTMQAVRHARRAISDDLLFELAGPDRLRIENIAEPACPSVNTVPVRNLPYRSLAWLVSAAALGGAVVGMTTMAAVLR